MKWPFERTQTCPSRIHRCAAERAFWTTRRDDLVNLLHEVAHHGSGVLGRNGRGSVDHFGLHGRVDIQVGTLCKAVGVLGGYVAGSQDLRDLLTQRARPFLFSTSHPPAVAAACLEAIHVLEDEP